MAFRLNGPILFPTVVKSTEANVHSIAAESAANSPMRECIGRKRNIKIILLISYLNPDSL